MHDGSGAPARGGEGGGIYTRGSGGAPENSKRSRPAAADATERTRAKEKAKEAIRSQEQGGFGESWGRGGAHRSKAAGVTFLFVGRGKYPEKRGDG